MTGQSCFESRVVRVSSKSDYAEMLGLVDGCLVDGNDGMDVAVSGPTSSSSTAGEEDFSRRFNAKMLKFQTAINGVKSKKHDSSFRDIVDRYRCNFDSTVSTPASSLRTPNSSTYSILSQKN
eukprot:TRINITY_DN714_c0_g2_i1.p1 TRINITY_DN714_c0_g2~~TRINITY_DN714_c0_g2_i1.p1  ORF type:complete len:129 (+),score=16.22 TRINITY_DN714_c0_g2_i1:23-388(+)